MFQTLLKKELRSVLLSPKFAATFAVCSALILLAVATGLAQYKSFARQQSTLRELTDQQLAEQTRWFALQQRALRPSDPLQIFATGSHQDIGRYSPIHAHTDVELRQSVYEDDPILAIFRDLDLSYVLQVVLTLYALLFTYDAISGERESGVLRLVFSNPVPRRLYVTAKVVGSILGLGIPLLIPILLSLLLLPILGISLSAGDSLRIGVLLFAGGLLFTFFVVFGVAVSTHTRRSSTSFLVALSAWVILVLVVPRVGVLVAAELDPVPSPAEIAAQKDGVARDAWARHEKERAAVWEERESKLRSMDEDTRRAYEDDQMWGWMQEDDAARTATQGRICEESARLDERLRSLQQRQERLAFGLSRWAAPAAFRSVAMRLAGTHVDLARSSEQAMRAYREEFRRYQLVKDPAGGAVTMRSDGGREVTSGDRGTERLDLGDMPRFRAPGIDLAGVVGAALPDLAMLVGLILVGFGVAVRGFGRYDAR